MNQRIIASVRPGEQDRCVGTLVDAFAEDPVARWLFPNSSGYLDHFPKLVRAFADVAVSRGTTWEIDDSAGAAVWLAPGSEPDEAALADGVGRACPRIASRAPWSYYSGWPKATLRDPIGTCH